MIPSYGTSNGDTRQIVYPISEANIRDQVAQLLYAVGYVKDDEKVVKMTFGKKEKSATGEDIIQVTVDTVKEGGVGEVD